MWEALSDIFVICLLVVFGVSAIVLGWEKQQEKYERRRNEKNKKEWDEK